MRSTLSVFAFALAATPFVAAADPAAPAAAPGVPDGWTDLMKPDVWRKFDAGWIATDKVELDAAKKDSKLKAAKVEGGPIWVNGVTGRLPDLLTKKDYRDCEAHVEFLIAKGANAGVKFHAMYEIQIRDTAGLPLDKLDGDSLGGIYPRAEDKPKYHHIDHGTPPKVNAAKPAGEWQTLDIVWRSPRFGPDGKKTENAKVVKAVLNGQVVQENQELLTHTGSNYVRKEVAGGPFMLQADHGPVAFRNVRIKAVEK